MLLSRYLAAVAAAVVGIVPFAALGIGFAGPAYAEGDSLEGVYTRTIIASSTPSSVGNTGRVVFTPCGTGCTHWFLEDSGGSGFDMILHGDKWIRQNEDTLVIIDKSSLEGTASLTSGELSSYMKFTLTPAG